MIQKKACLLEPVLAVLGALCIKNGSRQRQQLASSLSKHGKSLGSMQMWSQGSMNWEQSVATLGMCGETPSKTTLFFPGLYQTSHSQKILAEA